MATFTRLKQKTTAYGKTEEIKGWLAGDIFLCKADSLTNKYPWISFTRAGNLITDTKSSSREEALQKARRILDMPF